MSFADEEFSGDSFDLDSLLQESVREQAAKESIDKKKKLLRTNLLGHSDRKEIEATVNKWEMGREWLPEAKVAYFDTQVCSCGRQHTHFRGIFQQQRHKLSTVIRYIQVDGSLNNGLPSLRKVDYHTCDICVDCATSKGYL